MGPPVRVVAQPGTLAGREDDLDAGGVEVTDQGVEARELGGRVYAARRLQAAPAGDDAHPAAPSPRSTSRMMPARAVDSAGSASSCGERGPSRRSPAPAPGGARPRRGEREGARSVSRRRQMETRPRPRSVWSCAGHGRSFRMRPSLHGLGADRAATHRVRPRRPLPTSRTAARGPARRSRGRRRPHHGGPPAPRGPTARRR